MVAQPDERHANRTATVLERYDRHRAYNILRFKQEEHAKHHSRQNFNSAYYVSHKIFVEN